MNEPRTLCPSCGWASELYPEEIGCTVCDNTGDAPNVVSPVPAGDAGAGARLTEDLQVLRNAVGLYASVIKSGEQWSDECQRVHLRARAALDALQQALGQ